MEEFSSKPLAGLDTFRDVRDAYFKSRLDELKANGISLDVVENPEVQNALRAGFAKFAFEGMGPGSEFNYDTPIVAEGLRALGFSDVVMPEAAGPPLASPSRIEMTAALAEQVMQLKAERDARISQTVESGEEAITRNDGGFFGRLGRTRAATERTAISAQDDVFMRTAPAAIGTALQLIDKVPLLDVKNPAFDPRAKENTSVFRDAVTFRVKSYDLPGVKTLTDSGVPHWLADFIVEDLLDPSSWVNGQPIAVAAAGLGGALGGRLVWRTGRALLRRGNLMAGDAVIRRALKIGEAFEDRLARPLFPQSVEPGDLKTFAAAETGTRKKAFEEFSNILEANRGGIPEGRIDADGEFLGLVKKIYDSGDDLLANELMDMRTGMTQTGAELASFQKRSLQALGDLVDTNRIRREDVYEMFFNRKTETFHKVEPGLVASFVRNQEDFITMTGKGPVWRNDPVSQRLKVILEGILGEPNVTPARAGEAFQDIVTVGQGRHFMNSAAGLEWARKNMPEVFNDIADRIPFGKTIFKGIAPASQRFSRTPMFQSFVTQGSARQVERGAWTAALHEALGGRVYSLGDAVMDQAVTSGSGIKLKGRSQIMRPKRSMFSPMRILDKMGAEKARLQNDVLVSMISDNVHKEAVRLARARDGLRPLQTADFLDKDLLQRANAVRRVWDTLGNEATRLGYVSIETLHKNYLPRIVRGVQSGLSVDDVIKQIRKGDGPVSMEAEPFFAMLRHGENPENLITDLPKLFDMYVQGFLRHKYLRPVVNDVLETITSSASTIPPRDRIMMLEYLHHQLGGTSRMEAKAAANLNAGMNTLLELGADQPGLLKYVKELTNGEQSAEDALRWAARQQTDLMYTHFIGGKLGLPVRNMTQPGLGIPLMGGGVGGWDHLRRGAMRMMNDRALRTRYTDRARLWNWHSEFFEFAEESFDDIAKEIPSLLSDKYKRALMLWYQASDIQNRQTVWAGGFDYAEDVVRKVKAGRKSNVKRSMGAFNAEEKARLSRLLDAGDYDTFVDEYADAVVNNSQWLYNKKNRPLWAQKGMIRGTLMVFATWPMNYGAALGRYTTQGLKGGASNIVPDSFRAMTNAMDYMLPTMLIGGALEFGGRAAGIGGMGDWLLPELSEYPGGRKLKETLGFEPDDRVLTPFPVKPVLSFLRVATGDEPVEGPFSMLRAWFDMARASLVASGTGFVGEDGAEARARANQQLFKSVPLIPQVAQPYANMLGEAMGIDPDVEYREGIFQEVMGAILQMREQDLGEGIRRSNAMPQAPGEQNRFLLPVEGVR